MRTSLSLVFVAALSTTSCAHNQEPGLATTSEYESTVKREVEATIRGFFDGFSKATCTDGRPVAKYLRDPTTFVLTEDIYELPGIEAENGVRERACTWKRHDGVVKSVVVEPISATAAVAAWTYRDDILLNSGLVRNTNGAVLMTLKKFGDSWLITSTKTTETIEGTAAK